MTADRRRPLPLLLALAFAAVPLAGCFQAPDAGADEDAPHAQTSVARVQRIDVARIDGDALARADGPDEFLRELVDASLVVRVAEPGDYVLAYTDARGAAREETLAAMAPGEPRTVRDVDPLSGATLRRAGDADVVYERPSVQHAWMRAGPVPLGLDIAPGAAASYAYRMDAASEMELRDFVGPEGRVDLARMDMRLPFRGTMGWTSHDDGAAGQRLAFTFDAGVAEDAPPFLELEVAGASADGKAGHFGVVAPPFEVSASGGFSLWARDDQVYAARFDGGHAEFGFRVLGWSDTPSDEDVRELCADQPATRESPCELFEMPTERETAPQGRRHELPAEALREPAPGTPEGDEWRAAREFIDRVLSQDLVVGDSFTIAGALPETDFRNVAGASGSFELLLQVVERERVEVPAGAFDALRIAETARATFSAREIRDASYAHASSAGAGAGRSRAPPSGSTRARTSRSRCTSSRPSTRTASSARSSAPSTPRSGRPPASPHPPTMRTTGSCAARRSSRRSASSARRASRPASASSWGACSRARRSSASSR